jgi:hypothetical protein
VGHSSELSIKLNIMVAADEVEGILKFLLQLVTSDKSYS